MRLHSFGERSVALGAPQIDGPQDEPGVVLCDAGEDSSFGRSQGDLWKELDE